jgi:CBS domain-containing protein
MRTNADPGERRARVHVGEVMHAGVVFCVPQASLRTVAQIMARRRIHAVVVSDLDMPVWKHKWGVITDLDVVRAFDADVHTLTAAQIATADPPTARADESLTRGRRAGDGRAQHDAPDRRRG